jgi:branched-subunit amino acid transport protein
VAEESYIQTYLVRMLLFLLNSLCLTVTVADWLGYVNPNIQTWLLAASTFVAVLTYVAYDL